MNVIKNGLIVKNVLLVSISHTVNEFSSGRVEVIRKPERIRNISIFSIMIAIISASVIGQGRIRVDIIIIIIGRVNGLRRNGRIIEIASVNKARIRNVNG